MSNFKNELNNYQPIPRKLIFDSSLSDRARFVFCYMASKPNDWDFYLTPMAKEIGYSVDTLRKYINELVESGWLEKGEQEKIKGNLFGSVPYTLKSEPTKSSDTEKFRHGKIPTQHNRDNNIKDIIDKEEDKSSKKEDEEFVDRMYKLYPSQCPKRNHSLGKSQKDKLKISRLLKTYSKEQIEAVIRNEIETKYGKEWMQNFSTFLNNFPDPEILMPTNNNVEQEDSNNLLIGNTEYR